MRIHSLKFVDGNPVLNLAEVQAFSPSGTLHQAVGATLSSTQGSCDASKCIDGDLRQTGASNTICHNDYAVDKDPSLVVDYGVTTEIASIRVFNRQEADQTCGNCAQRIVGATISVTADKDGREAVWRSTFQGVRSTYAFQPVAAGETWSRSLPRRPLPRRPASFTSPPTFPAFLAHATIAHVHHLGSIPCQAARVLARATKQERPSWICCY